MAAAVVSVCLQLALLLCAAFAMRPLPGHTPHQVRP